MGLSCRSLYVLHCLLGCSAYDFCSPLLCISILGYDSQQKVCRFKCLAHFQDFSTCRLEVGVWDVGRCDVGF